MIIHVFPEGLQLATQKNSRNLQEHDTQRPHIALGVTFLLAHYLRSNIIDVEWDVVLRCALSGCGEVSSSSEITEVDTIALYQDVSTCDIRVTNALFVDIVDGACQASIEILDVHAASFISRFRSGEVLAQIPVGNWKHQVRYVIFVGIRSNVFDQVSVRKLFDDLQLIHNSCKLSFSVQSLSSRDPFPGVFPIAESTEYEIDSATVSISVRSRPMETLEYRDLPKSSFTQGPRSYEVGIRSS